VRERGARERRAREARERGARIHRGPWSKSSPPPSRPCSRPDAALLRAPSRSRRASSRAPAIRAPPSHAPPLPRARRPGDDVPSARAVPPHLVARRAALPSIAPCCLPRRRSAACVVPTSPHSLARARAPRAPLTRARGRVAVEGLTHRTTTTTVDAAVSVSVLFSSRL
jgi:hypothetical protein